MAEDEAIVGRAGKTFSEEALKSSDGTLVPMRLEPGGRIIGEAVLRYDEGEQALKAEIAIDDPKVAEALKMDTTHVWASRVGCISFRGCPAGNRSDV